MVLRLLLHEDAKRDLAAIKLEAPRLAVRLGTLLQELSADEALLEMLTAHDFGSDRRAAFVNRDFNYDSNHLITRRILRAYDDL